MKTRLFLTAMAVCFAFSGFAQTKGTNALGLGINTSQSTNGTMDNETKIKQNVFSIGYGHFIKDNSKIGFDLSYNTSNQTYSNDNKTEVNSYGGNLSFQKYYPIVKTLFAYAGGRGGYFHGEQSSSPFNGDGRYSSNSYSLGAYGGITWFFSKRFALETSLLSANMTYSTAENYNNYNSGIPYSSKQTSFNLSTEGFINNLGFKIYILF